MDRNIKLFFNRPPWKLLTKNIKKSKMVKG